MATIRRQPFGYQLDFGEIVLQETEAETVELIYQKYADGTSFTRLAEMLQEIGVPYDGQRPWNKNMVARILENRKYLGEDGYPQIIPAELFEKVQRRRQSQIPSSQKTPGQKALKCLC